MRKILCVVLAFVICCSFSIFSCVQAEENTDLKNNMNLVNSVTGVVGSLLNGKIGSAITTGVQGYENYLQNQQTLFHPAQTEETETKLCRNHLSRFPLLEQSN